MNKIKETLTAQEELITIPEVEVFQNDIDDVEKEKIKKQAAEFLDLFEGKDKNEIRTILESFTIDDIKTLENSSELLKTKIFHMESIDNSDSNEIAKTLIQLSEEVSNIDPHKQNLNQNNFLSFLPFIGKPINRYLKKFKSASTIINDILIELQKGENLLRDDNTVLQHDKDRYKQAAIELQKKALMMQQLINAIEQNISSLEKDEQEFYINNLLLSLQKKIRSIYEILLITQEGFLSNDFIINTNWELIDNIGNVKVVTKRALEIGVSMLVALENQKSVLDAIEKTKETTNKLIVENAKRMNHQATEIYAQSGTATLNIEDLNEAFSNIDEAISKINDLNQQAYQQAKTESQRMQEISNKLEKKIQEVEKIEALKGAIV